MVIMLYIGWNWGNWVGFMDYLDYGDGIERVWIWLNSGVGRR